MEQKYSTCEEQQRYFVLESGRNLRLAERTMTHEAARAQFVHHFQKEEPDCVRLEKFANALPEGVRQMEEEVFKPKVFHAWAKVEREGETPIYYVLCTGGVPFHHTYIWARYV